MGRKTLKKKKGGYLFYENRLYPNQDLYNEITKKEPDLGVIESIIKKHPTTINDRSASSDGNTPIMVAIINNKPGVVGKLLQLEQLDVTTENNINKNAVDLAVEKKNIPLLNALIKTIKDLDKQNLEKQKLQKYYQQQKQFREEKRLEMREKRVEMERELLRKAEENQKLLLERGERLKKQGLYLDEQQRLYNEEQQHSNGESTVEPDEYQQRPELDEEPESDQQQPVRPGFESLDGGKKSRKSRKRKMTSKRRISRKQKSNKSKKRK